MAVVQPSANAVVRLLERTSVAPWQVVVGHTLLGFLAAGLVASASHANWLAAAVLLQVKTVLDNVDGGLARATGRVTEFGRYLDTLCDLAVNVALFAALARHGSALGSAAAFAIVTVALSADFGAQKRYEEVRGLRTRPATGAASNGRSSSASSSAEPGTSPGPTTRSRADSSATAPWLLKTARSVYRLVLAPQDRAYEALDSRLFRTASGQAWGHATGAERERWADLFSTGALVNLGLSTQYLALGVALALGMPYAYVVICWCQLPYLLTVQAVRVLRYRGVGGRR